MFKEEPQRAEDFADRDARLYTALLFFNLKMEQKAEALQREFVLKGEQGLAQDIHALERQNGRVAQLNRQEGKFETLQFLADQRAFIGNFKKGEAVRRLEELGVKVGIDEKIRDKVLASREKLSSSYAQPLVHSVSPYVIHTSKF